MKTYGNITKVTIKNSDDSLQTSSICEYTSDYNYKTKITDARGKYVQYDYNLNKGVMNWCRDANGNQTDFLYNSVDAIITNSGSKTTGSRYPDEFIQYGYNYDILNTLSHNSFDYNFTYDEYGNALTVNVGNQILSSSEYNQNGSHKKQLMEMKIA